MTTSLWLKRSTFFPIASLLVAVLLVFLLLKFAKVDLGPTIRLLAAINPVSFSVLVTITAVNALLAGEKWRIANAIAGARPPSRLNAFSLTAIGVGLGQLLPAQAATALARIVGARALGGGTMVRAGATTVFEQTFDIVALGCFAFVSAATLAVKGHGFVWSALALMTVPICWLGARHATRIAAACVGWLILRLRLGATGDRIAAGLRQLDGADPQLVGQLYLLSVLRFAALVGLAAAVSAAVGMDVRVWQLAAALPFAVLAIAVAATPGGLGVGEWAMTGALFAFGISMHTAVQWVVLSRILSTAASGLVGAIGAVVAVFLWRAKERSSAADR